MDLKNTGSKYIKQKLTYLHGIIHKYDTTVMTLTHFNYG